MRSFLSLSLLAFHLSIQSEVRPALVDWMFNLTDFAFDAPLDPSDGKAPVREELSRKDAKAQSAIAFLSPFFAPSSGDLCANYFLTQRREGGKKTLRNAVALCAFASLREKYFLPQRSRFF